MVKDVLQWQIFLALEPSFKSGHERLNTSCGVDKRVEVGPCATGGGHRRVEGGIVNHDITVYNNST